MRVSPQLSALCLRHVGFDPAELSTELLTECLPQIVSAVNAEQESIRQQARVIQKSAAVLNQFQDIIPNIGIIRDECVGGLAVEDSADPNAVFDSLIPMGSET